MKRLLLLGGSRYLIPAIKAAHKLGVYVITADYLPDNAAHKYADEYHNVSIVEKDTVYELAKRLKVDGIMSYATDPGVVVAAYVAENWACLPVRIIQLRCFRIKVNLGASFGIMVLMYLMQKAIMIRRTQ